MASAVTITTCKFGHHRKSATIAVMQHTYIQNSITQCVSLHSGIAFWKRLREIRVMQCHRYF